MGGRGIIKRVENGEKERQRENNRSICCNGDKKSQQCQGKTLCWWWKHWRALLAFVGSGANEREREEDWQRGVMRWSGLKRQPHIVCWVWERITEGDEEKVRYRYRGKLDSCIIPDHIDWARKAEKRELLTVLKPSTDGWEDDNSIIQKNGAFSLHSEQHPRAQWAFRAVYIVHPNFVNDILS